MIFMSMSHLAPSYAAGLAANIVQGIQPTCTQLGADEQLAPYNP